MTERWIDEALDPHLRLAMRADEVLREDAEGHRRLVVFRNAAWGTVLLQGGACRLATADAFVRHEMLAHVPLMAHDKPCRVLVIGGGDGGTLREILKHPTVEKATLIDADRTVIDAALALFPDVPGSALHDNRTEITTGDVLQYLEDLDAAFDVIIIDGLTSADAAPSRELFAACRRALHDNGVLAAAMPLSLDPAPLTKAVAWAASHFKRVAPCLSIQPAGPSASPVVILASDDKGAFKLDSHDLAKRQKKRAITDLSYWTPEVHVASFALPAYVARMAENGIAEARIREEEERLAGEAQALEAKERERQAKAAAKAARKEAKEHAEQEKAAARAAKKHAEAERAAAKAAKRKAKEAGNDATAGETDD